MPDPLGCLCLVLHGHLPYVLSHGSYPHGEAWLYEAAAETYLPILDMIGGAVLNNAKPNLTIGLTPVLLEQLAHERFKTGFVAYLSERIARAEKDRKEFEGSNQLHFAYLAQRWAEWYAKILAQFEGINRDLPGAFAQRFREGHIQLLTSNATHAYMPLILNDEMLRAQMTCGTLTSKKHLGIQPRGMWLPECAYRPTWEHWMPAVLYDNARYRIGIENFIAAAGVTHFFVDTHLITNGHPLGVLDHGNYKETSETSIYWDHNKGWRQPMSPVGVVSKSEPPKVFAFARRPRVSEQVWSGSIGYPGSPQYLEFHRKYGERGLRYHKVTSNKTPLSNKDPYYPDDVPGKIFEHAQHFCNVVRDVLRQYKHSTGKPGVIVAPFDAELFGHWWFEGPQFLRDVILTLNSDPEVKLFTAEQAMYNYPPDKVMRLPEGSWGENGNHSVWINDRNRWMWEIEYRAEGTFLRLLHSLPWKESSTGVSPVPGTAEHGRDARATLIKQVLIRAARQLLLLQASDWEFVVHSYGAVDYGIQRFAGHATNFDRATRIAEHLAAGGELTDLHKIELAEMDAHDDIFKDIDLNWWMPP